MQRPPFGRTGGISALQLENESISAFKSDVILPDGEIPFNENDAPITLESPVSRIVLQTEQIVTEQMLVMQS